MYSRERKKGKEKKQPILEALAQVGMAEKVYAKAKSLSGGEKQRVARAIVNSPSIILADEPTGSLDSKSAKEIMDHLHSLVATGKTLVLVTHDQALAAQCNRQIKMADGMVVNS